MNHKKDVLHQIIHQLNTEEIKQFKSFLQRGNKKSQALELFLLLHAMPQFDTSKYNEFVKRKKLGKSIASIKSQLKDKLIHWLTLRSQAPDGTNFYYELSKGEVLMNLGLHLEAKKLHQTIKEGAYTKLLGNIELLAITQLSQLTQFGPAEEIIPQLLMLSERMSMIAGKTLDLSKAYNYYMRTNVVFYESRSINKDTHRQMVQQLKHESLFTINDAFAPFEVMLYIYQVRTLIFQMLGDWQKAEAENKKLYTLILPYEDKFKVVQIAEFKLIQRDRLYYCLLNGNLEEYSNLYPVLYQKVLAVEPHSTDYELRIESIHILYLIRYGDVDLLQASLTRMSKYKTTPSWGTQLVANKKEALLFAGYGYMYLYNWKQAIEQFVDILNIHIREVGVDFDHTAQFMTLLCHFGEYLQNTTNRSIPPSLFLQNQCEISYNYIIRNKLESPLEKVVIKALKEVSKGGNRKEQQAQLLSMLKRLKAELHSPPPYYTMQLAEFNWVIWIEEMVNARFNIDESVSLAS